MQSRLFHAVVAAGLSLGAASAIAIGCSDSTATDRQAVGANEGGADATAPDASGDAIADSPFEVRYHDSEANKPPPRDAGADVDGDAGWPTTK